MGHQVKPSCAAADSCCNHCAACLCWATWCKTCGAEHEGCQVPSALASSTSCTGLANC